MEGWKDGWMDGRMGGWMHGLTGAQMVPYLASTRDSFNVVKHRLKSESRL